MTGPIFQGNEEHLKILKQGVEVWNRRREENPDMRPNLGQADLGQAKLSRANLRQADLRGADLSMADLRGANLREANLSMADLRGANLSMANLSWADLSGANLSRADLNWADLSRANLSVADLRGANLSRADFNGANLSMANLGMANLDRADLTQATFVGTDFTNASLTGCSVYGISAWDVNLKGTNQADLIISPREWPTITVDNLWVAQFIYLLLNNEEIRDVIDTITSKVVLILGRFTPERKTVLDAMREELRRRDYLPILFDFEKPGSRDLTETISTLAHMARFVIADITDAKSIPQELERIVPGLPSVPVQPLIASSGYEHGMFEHFRRYPWVLDTYQYDSLDDLMSALGERVIGPAERKAKELAGKT